MINKYIKNPSSVCVLCSQAITNPLCPSCLSHEILVWAEDKTERLKKICKNATEVLGQQSDRMTDNSTTTCISCQKHHSVCPFCFTESVVSYLRSSGVSEKQLNEFKEVFNYLGIPDHMIFH
ncbi:MAG: hypothetical protein KKF56_00710 [Nanoarchaeota archaeon]|nr:hypothetical protein [Nanoarchaeota archaeon]